MEHSTAQSVWPAWINSPDSTLCGSLNGGVCGTDDGILNSDLPVTRAATTVSA